MFEEQIKTGLPDWMKSPDYPAQSVIPKPLQEKFEEVRKTEAQKEVKQSFIAKDSSTLIQELTLFLNESVDLLKEGTAFLMWLDNEYPLNGEQPRSQKEFNLYPIKSSISICLYYDYSSKDELHTWLVKAITLIDGYNKQEKRSGEYRIILGRLLSNIKVENNQPFYQL